MRLARVVGVVLTFVVVAAVAGSASAEPAAPEAFRRTFFAKNFSAPVLLTHAPGEPTFVYVVEQPGRVIRRARSGKGVAFLDIVRDVDYGGERGLLGLAFHPGYRSNRLFYVAYTSRAGNNVVARYRSNGRTAIRSSRKILLNVDDPYGNHNGGHLAFGRDGMLYTSIGDGGSGGDPEDRSQNMSSPFGKLLRLDVGAAGVDWEIAGLGLRNPWRFSFDRRTGDLYTADVGQGDVEEVNFTPRDSPGLENYGWNLYEGSRRYKDGELGPGNVVFPIFEYDHDRGCSVTGGYVYRGRARPAEQGRYVFGDYCSGTIWSFRVRSGKARSVRVEPFRIPGLTSFGEDAAGELYATTESGTIYRLT